MSLAMFLKNLGFSFKKLINKEVRIIGYVIDDLYQWFMFKEIFAFKENIRSRCVQRLFDLGYSHVLLNLISQQKFFWYIFN